jgi:hypothetical protein
MVRVDEIKASAEFRIQLGMIHLEHETGELFEADAAIAVFIDAIEHLLDFILHEAGNLHLGLCELFVREVCGAPTALVVGSNPDASGARRVQAAAAWQDLSFRALRRQASS